MTNSHHQTSGHELDWREMLATNQRWLRAVAFTRLGDADAVDEVMQEVALAVARQSSPLRDAAKVSPWLYRLTLRQALLYRRRQGRTRRLHERAALREEGSRTPEPDPLDWLIADERRGLVRRAVSELPARDAEVLMLKYQEGWSYAEIAGRLGVSSSAVEARLHRARGRLRKRLSATGVIEVAR